MKIDFGKMITAEEKTAEKISKLKQMIAERRYQEETRGITVAGFFLNTERDSQALLTGAALEAFMDSSYTCRWKTAEGFVELDSASLINISRAMRQHVQSCFNREADLLEALENGSFTSDMLEVGWP